MTRIYDPARITRRIELKKFVNQRLHFTGIIAEHHKNPSLKTALHPNVIITIKNVVSPDLKKPIDHFECLIPLSVYARNSFDAGQEITFTGLVRKYSRKAKKVYVPSIKRTLYVPTCAYGIRNLKVLEIKETTENTISDSNI